MVKVVRWTMNVTISRLLKRNIGILVRNLSSMELGHPMVAAAQAEDTTETVVQDSTAGESIRHEEGEGGGGGGEGTSTQEKKKQRQFDFSMSVGICTYTCVYGTCIICISMCTWVWSLLCLVQVEQASHRPEASLPRLGLSRLCCSRVSTTNC